MADAITIKALQDASLDAKSLEEVVNGNESKQVTTRKGETYPSVKKAIKTMFENGSLPATPFKTKALMTASALVDGKYAMVTDDAINNGLYVKTAGAWVRSDYDPLTQAKQHTDASKADILSKVQNIFATKDLLIASSLPDGSSALVTDDDVVSNIGTYIKELGAWKKTDYDSVGLIAATQDDVSALQGSVQKSTSSNLFEFKDSEGVVTLKQDRNGDIHIPSVGNLTKTVEAMQGNTSKGVDNTSVHYIAAEYADYAISAQGTPVSKKGTLITRVFINDSLDLSFLANEIRVPSVVRTSKNTFLLAFACKFGSSDFSVGEWLLVRITVDTELNTVATDLTHRFAPPVVELDGRTRTFGSISMVSLKDGRVGYFYSSSILDSTNRADYKIFYRESNADLTGWTTPQDLSHLKNDEDYVAVFPCPQGIVQQFGTKKGRIVFPMWTTGVISRVDSAGFRAGFYYSDDGGVTWDTGKISPYSGGNEVEIAEDVNGDLIFCIRTTLPNKVISRYSYDTEDYVEIEHSHQLSSVQVMSGFSQGRNKFDNTPPKLMISSPSTNGKKGLDIHSSYNGGLDWRTHQIQGTSNEYVGYSTIHNLGTDTHFLTWEAGGFARLDYCIISTGSILEKNQGGSI